jgi:hypothetical protein
MGLRAVARFAGLLAPSAPGFHGFADSPVALFRHPLRGLRNYLSPDVIHGFADSPVALFRHPLRGLRNYLSPDVIHGFADSPVALFRHPLRGLGH